MLITLDGSDDDKIKPKVLTTPVVVPCGADLTTDDDAFNNLTADKIEIQIDWDDDVNDDGWKQQNEEAAYDKNDLIIEADNVK